MTTFRRRASTAGFTLIELLTVIAIIGILSAILIPTIGAVREKAQRAVDANNLREIVKAAMIYAGDNNDRLPDPKTVAAMSTPPVTGATGARLWAGILAQRGILTDANFYFAKNDPQFSGSAPASIVEAPANKVVSSDFISATDLSVELVGGLRMGDPATTPVAFTRGLTSAGTWDAAKGVYKDAGGYIAFLGGNVQFYPNTTEQDNQFTLNNGKKGTNLRQALRYTSGSANNPRVYGTTNGGIDTGSGTESQAAQ